MTLARVGPVKQYVNKEYIGKDSKKMGLHVMKENRKKLLPMKRAGRRHG